MSNFNRITDDERHTIGHLFNVQKMSIRKIANELNRSISSISPKKLV